MLNDIDFFNIRELLVMLDLLTLLRCSLKFLDNGDGTLRTRFDLREKAFQTFILFSL